MAKILICDDADFMRMVIREALENGGHEVVGEAKDPDRAIELYRKFKPDLVTMDLIMKKPGAEAIKTIREFDPKARIVIISVLNDQEGEVIDAIRQGALGIVTKPIKREVLLSEVERVLKKEI